MRFQGIAQILLGVVIGLVISSGFLMGDPTLDLNKVQYGVAVPYKPHMPRHIEVGKRRKFTEKHLVVSHFRENLDWLKKKWGSAYTHTIYEMGRRGEIPDFSTTYKQALEQDGSRYYLTNFGDESSGYLRFIIDNYDDLPNITVFLHGTPMGHNSDIGRWISHVKETTWFTFLTTGWVENRCILDMHNKSLIPNYDEGAFIDFWLKFPWSEMGLGSLPRCLSLYCCAEFAVSRDAIRSQPLMFYKELWSFTLNFVLDQNTARKYKGWSLRQIGGIYEHSWHVMFGEPMTMQRYENYCDYFNPGAGSPCRDQSSNRTALPPNHPTQRSQRGILIMDAFIGSNCNGQPAPQEISAIVELAKRACSRKMLCKYNVMFPKDVKLGRTPNTVDPTCSRDYQVSWLCPQDPAGSISRRLSIPPSAIGKPVKIDCRERKQLPKQQCVNATRNMRLCNTSKDACVYEVDRNTCSAACSSVGQTCILGVDNDDYKQCGELLPRKLTGCDSANRVQLCHCMAEENGGI
eukprot:TRINITY_DN8101_c0_g1_i1.p1 TRINITY_DN8101_c0_g1~~TRINITY_DN8101_c0_g1_i1.p1  ORF type:complete len:549 (+),score=44.05 TRINITY_DN8101_c0_g1_i1:94-1647(+)